MKLNIERSAVAALVAFAVLSTPTWAADKYGVKDDAKFFTPAAVEKANQKLEELSKKYGANFRIETVVLPPDEKAKVDKLQKPEQGKHFQAWAKKRFNEYGIGERGGYILVVKSPGQVQAHIGDEVGAKFFGESNRKKLVDRMVADLSAAKGKAADPALDNALAMFSEGASKLSPVSTAAKPSPTAATTSGVKETAAKTAESVKNSTKDVIDNAKKDAAKGKEAVQGMSTSTLIILGVVVALVLLFALKGLFGGGRPRPSTYTPPPPQGNYGGQGGGPGQGMNQPLGYGRPQSPPPPQGYPQQGYPQQGYPQGGYPQQPQGGGGGFMKGMLGGMLGGAAGAYMYDKMSGGHAHGGTPTGGSYPAGTPASGGGDYGASGDFSETGPAAGGGDYGASGDFGGDDAASGGDYGASGDIAESSGGDYGASGDFGGEEPGGDYGASGDFGGDDGGGGSGDFDDES
jgi:hypothetical protein